MDRPRRIKDAIIQAILTSDLVIADLTGKSENVYYELGVAHAVGCDVILLTQEASIPFDIATERAIFYKGTRQGITELRKELIKMAGGPM
jgi:nucleoside 2-deoxyribosyltransferase